MTTLYSFNAGTDGGHSTAGLVSDAAGNLYGTTVFGGDMNPNICFGGGCGTVFEVTPSSKTESVLYSFIGGTTDGSQPGAGLIMDGSGNLYGTTNNGGLGTCFGFGCGIVFEVTPPTTAGNAWTESVLHFFTGGDTDGQSSLAGLIMDGSGNLYGTTQGGGNGSPCIQCGTVFEVTPSTKSESLPYSFNGGTSDGGIPAAGLISDSSGNFFGTTTSYGADGVGTVFELTSSNTESVLYSFTGGADGSDPHAGLIEDAAGNLYGTTLFGGNLSDCGGDGCGVVFEIPAGGTEKVLYTFTGGSDGGEPEAGLIMDSHGNLYGTTTLGGDLSTDSTSPCYQYGCGVVFEITRSGKETVLHTFTGGNDGGFPDAGLIADGSGNLYSTTSFGGTGLYGTVFELSGTGFVPPSHLVGVPGKPNCGGASTLMLAQTFGGLGHAAKSLGYSSVSALQSGITTYCSGN